MAAIMRRTEPDRNPPTNPTKRFRAPMRAVLWVALAADLVVLPLASQAAAYFYTDLNPSGFIESFGYGISGSQQVGSRRDAAGAGHALLWSGTASSAVDLHPSGFKISQAYGSSGSQQVGYGDGHALLWSGTASGVVDLHPSGFFDSEARGISGGQQVGDGRTAQLGRILLHALLWSGTASSVVDLNPNGFTESVAPGTSGSQQVGSGKLAGTNIRHALLWSGTASSVVDLHGFLSSDYADSQATGIDAIGNVVGYATYIPTGSSHAILWTLVPERVVLGNEPGQCGAVYTYSTGSTAATCSPPSGSFFPVGNTTVTCTSTNPPNTFTFNVIVEDREAPLAACRSAPNPSGKKIPVAGKNGDSGQNPDGYYQLLAKDNCDAGLKLFVADTASAFIAGPFASGDIVKITQDPDDTPDSQPGAQNVVAHIHLNGDALLYAVDASGNVGATVLCAVVVPPKVAN